MLADEEVLATRRSTEQLGWGLGGGGGLWGCSRFVACRCAPNPKT